VAKPENKTDILRYDAMLRPLEARQSDGTSVEWRYPAEGGTEVTVSPAEDRPVRLAESADKSRRTVTYGDSDTVAADYDTAGRLTTLTENGQPVLWQEWNPDGSLRLMRTEACATHPEYDENGVVTSLLLAPPDERGTFTHYRQTTLDSAGRAREISDYSGLKVFMDYDTRGLLKTLIRKQDGKNYGFEITRDRSGRIETLDSTWGKQLCAYDAHGQLERVEVDKRGATLSIELESGAIKRVKQFDGGAWLFARDRAQAGITQVQAPNGLKLTYGYDADGQLRDAACGDFRVAYVSDAKQNSSGVTYERRSEARAETPVKLASAVTRGNDTTPKAQVGIPAEEAATSTQADPAMLGREWAKIGNTTRASGLDAPLNVKVGEDIIEEVFRSHHNETIAYRTRNQSLTGDSQGRSESIIKLIPNTGDSSGPSGNGIKIQEFLHKTGIAVPVPLPVYGKEKMVIGDDVIIIREQVAKGEELSKLRDQSPSRTLTEQDEDAYVRAMFDIGQKAKELPDTIANKPAIRNETQMRERLFDRNRLAQVFFFLYSKTPSYAQFMGENYWQTITGFHDAFNDFVNACWKNSPLSEVVYVHDAILSNCFIDKTNPAKPKVSIIDVIDDYVGSAGHLLSITLSQLRPAPGQTWTLAEFRAKLYQLLETYSMSKGVPLTEEQTTEIIQNMAFHPYKFVTSDSKQFIRQLGEECGLPPGASEQALVDALSLPQNIPKLDRLLKDESLHSKYKMEMLQIDYTLEVLSERLTGQTEKLRAIRKLQQIIREALKHDVRVASIEERGVSPQRACQENV
jgi:YD repeat-containing protein